MLYYDIRKEGKYKNWKERFPELMKDLDEVKSDVPKRGAALGHLITVDKDILLRSRKQFF